MNKTIKIAIKRHIVTPAVNLFYRGLFAMRRPCVNSDARYMFAICAIFRNEARYMREWIEYHLLIGVDHIFLYNNWKRRVRLTPSGTRDLTPRAK
ncbi:glycosyltransferase family 92 protein [Muribaculum gordoncarteri]|uniref:glycosyltransferase family 92 protein n=1 Tax=Muribaculum gordoncarteri TaxID=2530390 RepID=UPI00248CE326|nr:glycosyltransferase family 92 protein [Muribaculum gordoncarteri]